jgi:hypothetical protein
VPCDASLSRPSDRSVAASTRRTGFSISLWVTGDRHAEGPPSRHGTRSQTALLRTLTCARVGAGITNGRVYQKAEDPNDLAILLDVADVAKARAWTAGEDLKTAMERAGVLGCAGDPLHQLTGHPADRWATRHRPSPLASGEVFDWRLNWSRGEGAPRRRKGMITGRARLPCVQSRRRLSLVVPVRAAHCSTQRGALRPSPLSAAAAAPRQCRP